MCLKHGAPDLPKPGKCNETHGLILGLDPKILQTTMSGVVAWLVANGVKDKRWSVVKK